MSHEGIYRFTSIGRPVDPHYPTNRAVLVILPLAFLLGALIVFVRDGSALPALLAGLMFVLVTFGAWALTRELAPDDDPAAFIAMALAVGWIFLGADSVLLVFVALMLARIVNRTTGLVARPLDSLLVLALTAWAALSLGQPLLALVGALAFALDAALEQGRRSQWLPALACVAVAVAMLLDADYSLRPGAFGAAGIAFLGGTAAAYGLVVWRSSRLRSICDVTRLPLTPRRVQAGMVVVLLVALQAAVSEGPDMLTGSSLWASLVAVPLGRLAGLLRVRT